MKQRNPQVDLGFHIVLPRLVRTGYKQLTPIQKWLYTCLKDLCGDHGTCYRTLRVLSEETGISTGMLSESIPVLHAAGLIHAEKKKRSSGGKEVWHITIVDIWQANASEHPTKRSPREQSQGDECSQDEQTSNVHNVNVHTMNDTLPECSPRERECSQILHRSNNSLSNNRREAITEEKVVSSSDEDNALSPLSENDLSTANVEKDVAREDHQASPLPPHRNGATVGDPARVPLDESAMASASNASPLYAVGGNDTSTSEQRGTSERKSPQRPATQATRPLAKPNDTVPPASSESQKRATSGDAPDGGGDASVQRDKQALDNSYSHHDSTKSPSSAAGATKSPDRQHNAPVDNVADAPDRDGDATEGFEVQPNLFPPDDPAETPKMPPQEMPWSAEKLVRITEAKRIVRGKVGARFSNETKEKSQKSQRSRQLEAAKKIFAQGVTEDRYMRAYDDRNDEWWNTTKGSLTVEQMAAKTPRGVMRTLEVLEKLESVSETIPRKNGTGAQSTTRDEVRPLLDLLTQPLGVGPYKPLTPNPRRKPMSVEEFEQYRRKEAN